MNNTKICSRCKQLKNLITFIKNSRELKTCQTCRDYMKINRKLCEHNRQKQHCRDCNGTQICEHSRQKQNCKDCNGASICEHSRIRNTCKDCNGASICEHSRIRNTCKDCNGASICEHSRRRNTCNVCDPIGHLTHVCRARISNALKREKELSSKAYIGCSIEVFKQHIESQFKHDMTWENYGTLWHIDHKIPLKYDNPTVEEVIKRLHYLNTQPLYASENISKGNRYIS